MNAWLRNMGCGLRPHRELANYIARLLNKALSGTETSCSKGEESKLLCTLWTDSDTVWEMVRHDHTLFSRLLYVFTERLNDTIFYGKDQRFNQHMLTSEKWSTIFGIKTTTINEWVNNVKALWMPFPCINSSTRSINETFLIYHLERPAFAFLRAERSERKFCKNTPCSMTL